MAQALKNPTYAGVYTFGKTREVRRVLPDGAVRSVRRRRAREDWAVLIEDHHDAYVSWPQFLTTEAKLAANATKLGARPVREGTALCQGIIRCGECGERVGTRYSRKHRKVAYKCVEPTARCRTVTADTVDDAVAALFLKTMTPQQIVVALAAADEVADRQVRSHRAAELAVERARFESDRAERTFNQVEPENRLLARTLESRWEAKLAALAEAQASLASARAVKPALPDHDALLALAADLPRLWDAETTSPRDRKRLLRTLIADVTLLPELDEEMVRVGVRWHTGASDELTVERRGPGRTPPEALAIVRLYGVTHSNEQISKMLNDAGLRTGKNLRFTPRHVAGVRGIYQIFTPRTVAVRDGEVSVKHAAQQLGIAADAIYTWLRKGQAPAVVRAGRWCIPWDSETQEVYRQKVAASFRLRPKAPAGVSAYRT